MHQTHKTVKCIDCGIEFQVTIGSYWNKKAINGEKQFRCKSCQYKYNANRQREYYKNMTDDDRAKLREKISKKSRDSWANMTDEQRAARVAKTSEKLKEFYMNTDKVADRSHKISEARKAYWRSLSEEELTNISNKHKLWWENLPDDIKTRYSETGKAAWSKLSDEDRRSRISTLSESFKHWYYSLSDEEKSAFVEKRIDSYNLKSNSDKTGINAKKSESHKHYWESLPESSKTAIINQLRLSNETWRKTVTDRDMLSISSKISDTLKTRWKNIPPDIQAEIMLKSIASTKRTDNGLHRKFINTFNASELTNEFYLSPEYISCYNGISHCWDYGVFNKNAELVAVVDLDGAYYHADECDYDGMHCREEYDEKRWMSILPDANIYIINEKMFVKSFEYLRESLICGFDSLKMLHFFRLQPFPYPHHTKIGLLRSYDKLTRMNPTDKYHKDLSINTRQGDWLAMEFHQSIWHDHRDGELSPYEAWNDDAILHGMINSHQIYQTFLNPNKILQGFNPTRVQFMSGGRAKMIISRYLEEFDTIFDPFSGYSGRLLGTISSGKRYIGQDISERHVAETNNIIDFLHQYAVEIDATVIQKDVFQSSGEYPCLFTCPPTGNEVYEDVPVNNMSYDDWIDVCLERFKCRRYVFVVDTTEKYRRYIREKIINKSIFGPEEFLVLCIERGI